MTAGPMVALARAWMVVGLTAMGAAQQTWIVDWQNGAGTHFTDLPPALAAANDGDTVVVRGPGGPGFFSAYTGAQTSRGITLLGLNSPNLLFNSGGGNAYAMYVLGLPAGRTFVMKGFEFNPAIAVGGWVRLENCQGRVLLDELGYQAQFPNTLEVVNCAHVTVTRCKFGPLPTTLISTSGQGLRCSQSVVALTETSLGGAAAGGSYFHGSCNGYPSLPAVDATDSVLTLAGGEYRGGDGFNCLGYYYLPASPAIQQVRGMLILTGDTQTRCLAGLGNAGPAILADGGLVLRDPDVQLVPVAPSPAIVGTSQVTGIEAPYLKGIGLPVGYQVPIDLFAQSGDAAILLASVPPGGPVTVLPYGVWWLSSGVFPIATTVVGGRRLWQLSLPVPPGVPDGMVFAFQGVTATLTSVALSNPLVIALH